MPSLGADMTEGTLLQWRVKPGDAVKRGDIVAVVDTSKAEIEVEIFVDGTIDELLVGEGTKVPVGTPLATVSATGERGLAATAPTPPVQAPPPVPAPPVAQAPPPPPHPLPPSEEEHRLRISPVARRAAEELGVDVAAVQGTGPGGAITKTDVERSSAAAHEPPRTLRAPPGAPPAPSPPVSEPSLTGAASDAKQAAMRQAIGALMARSKREIPHYYLQSEIDMSGALGWLSEQNLERAPRERLLPAVMLLAAVARAAKEMPQMNGFWTDGAFHQAEAVHLGVAVSLRGGGLVAPALHEADRKSLDELMGELRDLVRRARAGVLRSSEMSDPTITVTNLGEQGADLVHGVIYAPQVALVGFGSIRERPWAAEGMVGARATVTATLAADHRAGDGHGGSRFLAAIGKRLQRPGEL